MKLKNFKKAMVIVDVLVIIALMVIMLSTNSFTQNFPLATAEKVRANAENMSFNLAVSPEETKTKAGETVTLIVSVADISAGENGINSIVGFLKYDEALFESVDVQGITTGTEGYNTTTDWNIELNKIQGHELYGKFCIYTIQENVIENQDVVKITMKLKSDLAPQTTEVNFTDLVSSDGDFEIADEDRTAVIIIEAEAEEDDDNQGTEGDGNQGTEGDGNQGTEGDGNQGTEGDGNQGTEGDGNQGTEGDGDQGTEGDQNQGSQGNQNQGSQGNQNQGSQGNQGNQSTQKPSSPQTGDTKILMIIAILILIIIANLLIFCKKAKTKIIVAVVTIIVGILSFVIVSNAQNTQNNTQPLTINDKINKISFQENLLNTDKVLVKDSTISAVTPEMTVEDFLNLFNTQIKVTDNGTQVTSGELKTGMKVSLLNPTSTDIDQNTIYEVVVAGDINKDGISNQIELTKIIRNTINNQKWQLNDIEKLAADMNFDGKIDNKDVEASVNYIVYGDSFEYTETVQEDIRNVDAPTIEIVQGQFSEEVNCYVDDVIIRITETDKNASKTRYKIEDENGNFVTLDELANNSSGSNSSTQYTGLAKFMEMERTFKDENGNVIKEIIVRKDGIYKISALTDGELGNRSDITYKVIVKGQSDKKYTVTYDYVTNGGVSSTDSQITTENIDVTYNTPVDLSKQGTKQYYKFIGWNTDKDATAALSTFTMGMQDVTLYAIYERDIEIKLDPTAISMEYGNTQTITATTKNTGNIIWSSSDESIATVSNTGVVTAKKVGTVTITATASTDSTVTATSVVTVTPKTLTISAQADNKEYDGTTNVVNGQIIVNGILNADDVHVAGDFAYETATAGTAKKVNVTNITLSGADANNYKINETTLTTTSDITKAVLTATYVGETITYGETPDVKVTVTGFVNGETEDGQTMADGYVKPIVANSNTAVGTYTLAPQDGQATNYTFIYVPGTLEILNKELTSNDVTINLDQDTFTYTGTAIEPTVIIKDGNKNLIEGTDFTVTYTDNTNAGTATVTITGKGNYSLSTQKTFTINKATLTPSAIANNKVYDGTTQATGTITLTGAVNNETPTATGDFAFMTSTAENNKTVNVTNIKLPDDYAANYVLSTYTLTATADITPAVLTATYVSETITYGETPDLKVTVTGFVNGETEDGQTMADGYVKPTVTNTNTAVGTYELTPANGQATNYTFKYEKGNLIITAKDINNQDISVNLADSTVIYNGKEQKVPVTIIDNGVTLTEGTDYDVVYTDNKNVGTATVKVTLKGNYSGTKELSFEIKKATLTATYAGETIEYSQTPNLNVIVTGFVNGETDQTAEYYAAPTVTATSLQQGTYTLTPQGGNAKNYDFNYVSGLLVINAKLNVDIQLAETQFIYDGTAKEPAVIVKDENTPLVEGTDYDVVYSDNINAGTGTATVTLKGNYQGTVVKTFTIDQAQGTGSVSIEGWTYGEAAKTPVPNSNTNTQVTYQYTGTTNGGASYSSSVAPTQAGNYTVTATFDANNNYKGFTATANFVVDKKELTPTATANNKVYDGTTDATGTIILTGAVGTEMPTATATFTFENATAGNGKLVNVTNITLEDPWNENYKLTTDTKTTTADITKDSGTATLNISNWVYGDTASAPIVNSTTNDVTNVTYSYTGIDNTATTYGPSSTVPTQAGNYTVTATIPANENYEQVIVTDTFEIEKRTLTVTLTAQDKTYDGNTQATGDVILSNVAYVDAPTATATFTFENATAGDNKTVNVSNIALASEFISNYELDKTAGTTTANITKAVLTATYVSETITYGETPDVKVTVTGFVNGETEDGQTMADGYVKPIVKNSNTAVGTYTLTPQDGQATNYSFDYVSGVLEILSKDLTDNEIQISLSETEFTYDGTAKEPTVTVTDGTKTLTQGTDYIVTYVDNVNAGTATIIIDGAGNYSTQLTKTFKINKLKLTPSATVNSKVYDGTTNATGTITLSAAVNNENPTVTVSSIFTFDNATVGTNKTVTVSNIELEDVWKTNYELTQDTLILTNGEITKAELTATYLGENITYGDTPALNIHVDGFVNGEDETTAAGYIAPTVVITDKDGNKVNVQDLVVSGSPYTVTPKDGDATNYKFKYEDGVLVVNENPAIVTITLTPDSFVYDGTAKQPAITVTDIATGKVLTANTDYTFGYVDNINAGTGIVNITLIGNYTGIATETFDILQADGIASVTIEGWIYGEPSNNPVSSSSTNGTDNVTYLYTGTTNAGVAYSDSVAPTEAGNYKVTATFAQTQNYKEVKAEDDFTISKAQVAEPAVNTGLIYTGLSQDGVTSGSNYVLTGDAKATNAGDYTAIATLSNTDNYEWTDGTTAPKTYNWSIAKVQLTPSAIANNKVYDGNTTATGTITFAEAVNNEKPTATETFTFENEIVGEDKIVNVTNIALDSQWTTNYALVATQTQTTADITAVKLTATYISEEINYGENPQLKVEVTGFVNGETKETATGFTMPVVENTNTEPGEYELTPTGGSATNYTFDYVKGTLKINLPTYTITYELNDGQLEQGKENPNNYTQKSEDITLNNPTKSGYEFLGWTLTKLDGVTQDASIPSTSVIIAKGSKGNREYTANWNLIAPTVEVTAENLNVNLFENQTTTFIATVGNASNPSYQWYYGENAIEGATESTYAISTTNMNSNNYKGGEYSVKVTNNEPVTTLAETGANTTTATSEKLNQTVKYNEVSSAEQMKNFATRVNVQGIIFEGDTITQSAEIIDLSSVCSQSLGSWTPIGSDKYMFKGTFDGASKEVTNLYINEDEGMLGLFGVTKDSTIKNATVSGFIKGTGVTWKTVAGGIVARNISGTVENCTNNVNIEAISRAGGIAGKSEEDSVITNCINNGTITSDTTKTIEETTDGVTKTVVASRWIGGIAGVGQGVISNCTNTANIVGNRAGGISGISNNGQTSILNCINNGNLTGNQNGGITYTFKGTTDNYKISNCVNTGDLIVIDTYNETNLYGAGIANANDGLIERCYNTGNIDVISENYNTASIVGGIFAADGKGSIVRKCYNEGNIIAKCNHDGDSTNAMCSAGGIAGYIRRNTFIEDCYNRGNITADKLQGGNTNSAGGIVGYISFTELNEVTPGELLPEGEVNTDVNEINSYMIKDCYSTGDINGTKNGGKSYVGGVLGQYHATSRDINEIVSNTYYLNTSTDTGIDLNGVNTTSIAISKESSEMKEDVFVTLLGDDTWKLVAGVNEDYPVFGWQYSTFNIEYDLAGGELLEGVTNPKNYAESSANIKLNNPVRTGYTFTGWTGTDLTGATIDVTINSGSTGDRTYTATWTLDQYTVTYDYETNGGASKTDSSIKTENVNVNYNDSIDLTKQAAKDNYTFIGWNTDANATTAIDSLTMQTQGVTLYAIYSKQVIVKYDKNGGAIDVENTYTIYNKETSLDITTPEPTTLAGWTFKGYADTSTATTGDLAGVTKTITVPENTVEVTYYHIWAKTIAYDKNKPAIAEASYDVILNETTREVYYNNKFGTLPTNPSLQGFIFNGWYTLSQGGTQITQDTLAQDVPNTIYAQWILAATISATPEQVTLDLSDNTTQAITIIGSNYGTVSYESAHTNIATVDKNGLITAVTNGNTTITVTGSNGNVTDTVVVEVVTTPTSIDILEDSAVIGVIANNTVALNAKITPNTANTKNVITWSSNNTNIASVDIATGVVTGISKGTATITATTENGYTDTCQITVDGTAPQAPEVTVRADSTTGTVKGIVDAAQAGTVYTGVAGTYLTFAGMDNETQVVGYKVAEEADADFASLETVDSFNLTAPTWGLTCFVKSVDAAGNISEDTTEVTVKLVTLSITPETMTIENGKTGTLTPDRANVGVITWTSSDNTIATVSNAGVVTAKKVGQVTITSTSSNDTTVIATSSITVTKGNVEIPTAVTGLVYNAQQQTGVVSDDEKYTITGNVQKDAGIYQAVASLADPVNYQWADGTTTDKTIDWEITPKNITGIISADDKVYDGTRNVKNGKITVDGVESGDTVTATATFEYETSTVGTDKLINISNITLGGESVSNYAVNFETTTTTADITKATLTATYMGETIEYGGTPKLEVNVTGFVNGETVQTAEGYVPPTVANTNTEVGIYTLIPAGGDAINYTFNYVSGTLIIDLKDYTITYELNGGALESGKTHPTQYTMISDDITLNNPVKSGYEFLGWTGTGLTDYTKTVVIPTGSREDKTYIANWQLVAPTVSVTAENLDINLFDNETTTFTANVENAANPTYQWYYNDVAIDGATASTYSLPTSEMTESNYKGGTYKVAVTNNEEAQTVMLLADDGTEGNNTTTVSDSFTQTVAITVGTADQLKNLATRVNEQDITFAGNTIKQIANIDLSSVCGALKGSFTPIGYYNTDNGVLSKAIHGTYDGQNFEVTNLYIDETITDSRVALFGIIWNGTLRNLTVRGTITTSSVTATTAGIVGQVTNATIENCNNYVNVAGVNNVAGIIGFGHSTHISTIKNCKNYGTITGTGNYVGGIGAVGHSNIDNCHNYGNVSGNNVGGIVSYNNAASNISNCTNNGVLSGQYVGGICFKSYAGITNCTNNAAIACKYLGGITYSNLGTMTNCINNAQLTGNMIGGITYNSAGSIISCSNKGKIIGQLPSEETSIYVGGIACSNNGIMDKCYNIADVEARGSEINIAVVAGGIFACDYANSVVTRCYNTGNVYSDCQHSGTSTDAMCCAGGIVGYIRCNTIIDNCYNTGNVTANKLKGGNTNNAGGIIGALGIKEEDETDIEINPITGYIITNSYNKGLITTTREDENSSYNGGVIGQYNATNVDITEVVNNNYYLDTSAVTGVRGRNITGVVEPKTEAYMITDDFVTLLGASNWEIVATFNSNYPVLDWEYETNTITYDLAGGSIETGKTNPSKYATESENYTLVNPIKGGYTFKGWTGSNGTTPQTSVTIASGSVGDKTYTANWEANTYYLAYYDGTTLLETVEYKYDETKNLITMAELGGSKTGFTFQEWRTGLDDSLVFADGQAVSKLTSIPNNTVKIYAIWKRNVTFVSGPKATSTSASAVQYYNSRTENYSVLTPKPVDISSWTALGWREDTTADAQTITSEAVSSSSASTFYAVYSRQVTCYSGENKAKSVKATEFYNTGSAAHSTTLPTPTTLTGWTIRGWRTDTTAADRQIVAGGTSTTASAVYYAVYARDITFYHGTAKAKTTTVQQYYNSATSDKGLITMPTAEAINSWNTLGWRYDTTAGAAIYTENQSIAPVSELVYYAVYSRSITMKYNANGGTGTIADSSKTQYYNTNGAITAMSFTLPSSGFTKSGGKLSKWAAGSASGTQYNLGATYTAFSPAVGTTTVTQTMYAIWANSTYTVNYYNGATKLGSSSHTYGTAKALTTIANLGGSLSGYTFYGWTASTTATARTYTNGQSVNNLTTTDGGTVNLYAIWSRTATFISGNNKATTATATQYYNNKGNKYSVTTPSTGGTKSGWTLAGWRDDTTAAAQETAAGSASTSSSATFYAVYYRNITFYSGIAKATNTAVKQYYNSYNTTGSITTPSITAINNGFSILGWRNDTTLGASENAVGATIASPSTTYYAVYSRTITLKYNANGGTGTVANQTKTQYYNSYGNITSISFTLSANAFTNGDLNFTKWAAGSATGTQYEAGVTYAFSPAVSSSTITQTMYAIWSTQKVIEFTNGTSAGGGGGNQSGGGGGSQTKGTLGIGYTVYYKLSASSTTGGSGTASITYDSVEKDSISVSDGNSQVKEGSFTTTTSGILLFSGGGSGGTGASGTGGCTIVKILDPDGNECILQ